MDIERKLSMRKQVVIDLSSVDIDLFESYERKVIPLLVKHEEQLALSVRSVDGLTETHLPRYLAKCIHYACGYQHRWPIR